jgi:hypothetical protein
MNDTDWRIKGVALANCNCAWGCPCQFNGLPTTGQCEAVWAMHIEHGHYDGTRLDGRRPDEIRPVVIEAGVPGVFTYPE